MAAGCTRKSLILPVNTWNCCGLNMAAGCARKSLILVKPAESAVVNTWNGCGLNMKAGGARKSLILVKPAEPPFTQHLERLWG